MVRHTSLMAVAALAFAFAAGCGDDDDTRDAGQAKPRPKPAKVDLAQFLMQPGELPGFKPEGPPAADSSVEPFELPAAGVERLRRSGYVSTVYQRIEGDNGNAGVTVADLFQSCTGAHAWLEYSTSTKAIRDQIPGVKVRRFRVPGVSSARGWIGRDRHGNPLGQVSWVQGRCMLTLADEGRGDLAKPLSIAVKAIYERTNGACPATTRRGRSTTSEGGQQ